MRVTELAVGSRVFVYLRDSGGVGQERSVAEQRAAVERYCQERGWVIADYYIDEKTQSGDYARRTEFAALLDACKRTPPPVDGVLTYSFARFGRDEYDSQFYRLELRRNGVQVDSLIDDVPVGPMAGVIEAIIDTQNRLFLDNMSRHVREGLLANVRAGYAPGGRPPMGYRAVPVEIGRRRDGRPRMAARWDVDPEVAPKITRAFALAAEGVPYKRIIEQAGLPTTSIRTVHALLKNRTYLGRYKLGADEFPGPEALVDEATWTAVQARFVTRAEQGRKVRRMTETTFILSGLARCGECGALLEATTDQRGGKGNPWRSYRCRQCDLGRVNAAVVEPAVIRIVLDTVLTQERMGKLLARVREMLNDPAVDVELVELGPAIGAKKRAIGTLLDAIEQGAGAATYERLHQREAELAQLEERRRVLEERRQMANAPFGDEDLRIVIDRMRAQVTDEDPGVVRQALRRYVERVDLWRDRFRVEWREFDLPAVVTGYSAMPPRGNRIYPVTKWSEPLAFVTRI